MLKITVPNNNKSERNYIIHTLFFDFLGLEYALSWEGDDYHIYLDSGTELLIKDFFFNQFPEESSYLNKENIPKDIIIQKKELNIFIPENNIPVLFGNNESPIVSESNRIICFIDIFASSFFMLTRWEENVSLERDEHDRFIAASSLAFSCGFLNRPIVNEYVELLWNMLVFLGIKETRKKRQFEYTLTHDVDILRFYPSRRSMIKQLLGDLLKRKSITEAKETLRKYAKPFFSFSKDPRDPANSFQWLIDQNHTKEFPDHFYFMAADPAPHDRGYRVKGIKAQKLIHLLKSHNQVIGFHPSYESLKNPELFIKEKNRLENATGLSIHEGRQHFLRFEIPKTWQIWEDAGMRIDSSLSYADSPGFRCGTCWEFPVYNILTRKTLKLRERPLIIMEGSLMDYQGVNEKYIILTIFRDLAEKCLKYRGNFVLLWHNSYLDTKEKKEIYQTIVKELAQIKKELS